MQGIVSKWIELRPRTPTELPGAASSSVLRRIGISGKTMDRAMAGEAALTFAQKGLAAGWSHVI
jgi:hypothetical protein